MSKKRAPRGKRTKKAKAAVEPSAQSLGEVPEMHPLRHELEREQLGAYLAELDAERGPISRKVLEQARAAWRAR